MKPVIQLVLLAATLVPLTTVSNMNRFYLIIDNGL